MHRRLLQLARDSRLVFIITVLSGLLAGLLTIAQAYFVSGTINAVFLEKQSLAQVMGWMQLILFIIAGRGLFTWLNELAANAVAVHIKTGLRQRLFAHIMALGPAYSRGQRTGDLTAAAVEGVEALDAYYSQYLPQLVISTLVPISVLLIVFPLDPLSGIVLLVTAPLIPFFMYMIGKGAEAATGRQYETLTRLSAHFLDSLQGLTTLKLFGQSKAQVRNIAMVSDQFRDTTLKVLQVTFLSALALELLATVSTAVIAVEVGLRLLYARMEFHEALFILILAPEFYLPLRMLGLRFHAGMAGTSAARRIFEILDIPLPASRAPGPSEGEPPTVSEFSCLEICDVSYTYPGEAGPALRHIELEVHAGERVALVGKSGSGKSTLMSLVLCFMEPQGGEIRVNGKPLAGIPAVDWRRMLAWVPQKPYLLNESIEANIKLGSPGASHEQVIEAARRAHLDDFVETLPEKYATIIGEAAARLSSGQAQRLALARAFLLDAPILLLDEPTSSLDPETEALLEDSTRRLMRGRTVITIAHRLNTVFSADRIVVMDAGRILEAGKHEELLGRAGPYHQLVGDLLERPEVGPASQDGAASEGPVRDEIPPVSSRANPATIQEEAPVFRRLVGFLRGSWGWVGLSVLLSTLTIGSSVALMGTSAWLISMAGLHPSIADLGVSIVGVRFFGIARGVFRYLERLVSHNVTFRLLARLRTWFYEKLEPLAPARLQSYHAGDLLARIVGDVETLENFYIRVVSPPLTAILIATGAAFFLSFFDLRLALLLLAFFLVLGILMPAAVQILSGGPGIELVKYRGVLHTRLVEGIQGMADLLAFNRGRDTQEEIAASSRAYGEAQRRMARIGGVQSGLTVFLTNLALWLVMLLCIPHITAGSLPGVMLAPLALLTLASFEAVTPLPLAAQMWSATREAARRLFEVVDMVPQVPDPNVPTSPGPAASRGGLELELRDLTFWYPGQSAPAIQGISFAVEAGEILAIVGPSGAGKSTLANLLLRFWDFSAGDILLAGRSIRDYAQEDVRAVIGLVYQNTHFFNSSIRENLRFARRGISQLEIEEAARKAQIHETILQLPRGYDTMLGEQGQRLSGGERQRLAIARLLIKDAPIWILDEPTANLDPLTERQVLETLLKAAPGRTILLITHRLVGLEDAARILVMDHGRIVQSGTEAELLRQQGLYRRLWDLQNQALIDPDFRAPRDFR
jgi:ATP-binding cassette subfamily C protein CydCD